MTKKERETELTILLDNYRHNLMSLDEVIEEIDELDREEDRKFNIDDFRNGVLVGIIIIAFVDYVMKQF